MRSYAIIALLLAVVSAAPSARLQARDCNFVGCAASLGPTVVTCVAAALQEEIDPINDAFCYAAVAATAANKPASCEGCY